MTHIVVWRFRDDLPEAERQTIVETLKTFPSKWNQMRRFRIGPNRSKRDSHFTHAFVIEFDSEAEMVAYLDSGPHNQFVAEIWKPAIAERAIVSFEHEPPV